MLSFNLLSSVKRLLCIGAHPDDIEIGAGATIIRLLRQVPHLEVTWCVLSGNEQRRREASLSAERFLQGFNKSLVLADIPDSFFPDYRRDIKKVFEDRLRIAQPDLILTHCRDDRHQDHRTVNELTWNSFRAHQILEYEIPKWDGDLIQPNVYVPAEESDAALKVQLILEMFASQGQKHWFDKETFLALMRLRGLESNCRYAEAFVVRKLVVA